MVHGIIYHAFDTTNGKAYVGQTWRTLEIRKKEHLKSKSSVPFLNALRLRPKAFVWTILTANLRTQDELDNAEVYWGTYFECLVPNGYNLKLGKARGKISEEQKLKIGDANRGSHRSRATKEKMSHAQRTRVLSPEALLKMSMGRKGKRSGPLSDETKLKMSIAHRGAKFSSEHKRKLSEAAKGRKFSAEHKAKLRVAAQNRWKRVII